MPSQRNARGSRLDPTLAYAGAALLAVGGWLARPRPERADTERGPALRALVVDASASAVAPRPDWRRFVTRTLLAEARAAEALGEDVLVVAFAVSAL